MKQFARTHALQLAAVAGAVVLVVAFAMGKVDEKTLVIGLAALGFPTGYMRPDHHDGREEDLEP